jgi:hypothetical protein
MPGPQYWFSGAALWPAAAFLLSVVLAVIGIKTMISDKTMQGTFAAAAMIALVGWWTAAEQEQSSAKRDEKFDAAIKTLDLIKGSLPPIQLEGAVANISSLTNTQIKKLVQDLTAKMRNFEQKRTEEVSAEIFGRTVPQSASEDQRREAWLKNN